MNPKTVLILLLLLILTACGDSNGDSDESPINAAHLLTPPPTTECASMPDPVEVSGWRFQIDPDDEGLDAGWYLPDFDDSAWRRDVIPGAAWENTGVDDLAGYDGVGWYRATIMPPDWEFVYLVASGIDDTADVWINGDQAAQWELGDSRAGYLNLHDYADPGEPVTLVFRVEDRGVYGGLVDPVRLAPEPQLGMTPAQVVAWTADNHPDWPMPGWTQGRPLAWTLTGGINQAGESLVSVDGLIAPWPDAPTVEAWLYYGESGDLISGGGNAEFSLVNGDLPLPQWAWSAGDITLQNVLFYDAESDVTRWRVTVDPGESDRTLKLLIAVRPFAVNKTAHPVEAAHVIDHAGVWINGDLYLAAAKKADDSGAGLLADVMAATLAGHAPETESPPCAPEGNGAALLVYDLNSGESSTLHFVFPHRDAPPPLDVDIDARLADTVDVWETETGRVRFDLPDGRMTESLPASVGYLLLANDPDGPHPGSLAHDAVWVRDAAYTGLALLQAGHADTVKNYLPAIFDAQEASGRVPPIQGESIPWDDDEWDSQGQAIFLTAAYYRYTGDLDTLRAYYPNIRRAAEFLVELRTQTTKADDATRGLLPPSLSAEDIGPADHHHYWDDFWAVAGLEEAAYAAALLGESGDAAWMQAEADNLRAAILESVESVMGADPPYIPASVEDIQDSGMARGTVPALWPYRVFAPESPLLARAFDYYHQQWIAPFNGAYQHRQGQFWPYGGIELAHAYLRLGRGDVLHQILAWTLANQTLPGTYAWAEQVNPANGGFSGGDMPHAWAAASWFTLIREMVISENGESLDLFTLAPEWWFEVDRAVSVENAPTYFGTLQLATTSTIQNQDGEWQGSLTLTISGAAPPDGFRWTLPRTPDQIDGPDGTRLDGNILIIPPGGGTVTLTF